jgi:hypothetical protein
MAIDSFMLENAGSVVHARSYRRLLRDLYGRQEGVTSSGGCAVSEKSGTPNMSVDVAVGGVVVYGDDSTEQGSFYVYNDAVKNVAISASDPTNPRYDLIVARVRDSENSVPGDTLTIEVVQGTPAGAPAEPATPSSAYVLARVEVLASATSIVNARITDRRSVIYPGKGRQGCEVYNNVDLAATSGWTTITFNTELVDTDAYHSTSVNTGRITIPTGLSGLYAITANVKWDEISSVTNPGLLVQKNGNGFLRQYPLVTGTAGTATLSGVWPLVAGDYIEFLAYHASGSDRTLEYIAPASSGYDVGSPYFSAYRVGD